MLVKRIKCFLVVHTGFWSPILPAQLCLCVCCNVSEGQLRGRAVLVDRAVSLLVVTSSLVKSASLT